MSIVAYCLIAEPSLGIVCIMNIPSNITHSVFQSVGRVDEHID